MRPHADDDDRLFLLHDLIHKAMLQIDAAGIDMIEIGQLFPRRAKGIFLQNGQQPKSLCFQRTFGDLCKIFFRLPGEDDLPTHLSASRQSSFLHSESGVSAPSRMLSRIPGTE